MEKSIENIWKEGFTDKNNLIAPRVIDLYNKKSISTVDKLLEMGKANLLYIAGGSIFLLVLSVLGGAVVAGFILFALLMTTVYYGNQQAKKVELLDKTQSSYVYLKSVKQWLDETINGYTKLYRFVYPLAILTFSIGLLTSNVFADELIRISNKSPELITFLNIPLTWYIPILTLAALSALFTRRFYLLDLSIIYKDVFSKLDALIADMEELAK